MAWFVLLPAREEDGFDGEMDTLYDLLRGFRQAGVRARARGSAKSTHLRRPSSGRCRSSWTRRRWRAPGDHHAEFVAATRAGESQLQRRRLRRGQAPIRGADGGRVRLSEQDDRGHRRGRPVRNGVPVYLRDVGRKRELALSQAGVPGLRSRARRVMPSSTRSGRSGSNTLEVMAGIQGLLGVPTSTGTCWRTGACVLIVQAYDETEYIDSAIDLVRQSLVHGRRAGRSRAAALPAQRHQHAGQSPSPSRSAWSGPSW